MASSTNSAPPVAHARAGATRARGFLAHEWFYPAAALHAAIVLPLSVLALGGAAAGPAALSTPWAHAREMLTGFALAAIAGNQLPPMPVARGAVLLATWLAARACAITGLAAGPWLDAAFALALAARAVPRLVRSAKKWRNRALPALIASVCVAAVAAGFAHREAATPRAIADAFVLLLAALMLFMGGRIIAPAAAGQLYRQGDALAARVQPRIEAALLVAMAIAVTSALVPALSPLLAPACASAAALALARLLRWRLWAMRGRPDLLCFGAGYAWLVVGLGMLALAQTHAARASALHAITVGALGTLALNVMGNTMLLKARRAAAGGPLLVAGTLLVAAAASFRIAAAFAGHAMALVGAACWSAAFAALLALAVRSRRSTAVTVGREGA